MPPAETIQHALDEARGIAPDMGEVFDLYGRIFSIQIEYRDRFIPAALETRNEGGSPLIRCPLSGLTGELLRSLLSLAAGPLFEASASVALRDSHAALADPGHCPACGNADSSSLSSLVSRDVEYHSAEVCESCRKYIKTVHCAELVRTVCPRVEQVLMLPLDVAAVESGYRP